MNRKMLFVADFIGESNIIPATMVEDRLVKILGVNFAVWTRDSDRISRLMW